MDQVAAPAAASGPLAVTSHPLQRAGAWAVAVLADRASAEEVTWSDLDMVASLVAGDVCRAAVAGKEDAAYDWWKVLFALFPNSKATHSKRPRDQGLLMPEIEALFAPDEAGAVLRPCTFCGAGAGAVWTKTVLPMFDTNKALNTLPPGVAGWPVCRGCRIAAWALPYGAWVTAGSATVLSCEEASVEGEFTKRNVQRARRILQVGFAALPAGVRPERVVLVALRRLRADLPAAATLWSFKNDNQEPWLRVTRTRRAATRFLATVDGRGPARKGWNLLERALTRRDKDNELVADGRQDAARLLFEADEGNSRSLLFQLYRLLEDPKRPWRVQQREDLTELAYTYATEMLGMEPQLKPVATLLADWIEHGSGSPRGRLAEYRNVALSDYKLGYLLLQAHFRLTLDGREVAAGPEDWKPLIQRRPRSWEQRMLLAPTVLQLLQQRGVAVNEKPKDEEAEEVEERLEQPILQPDEIDFEEGAA